jgi:uncharacterized repeat protein (TIGR01451 family)
VQKVYSQVDSWTGEWQTATPVGGSGSFTIPPQLGGLHTVYAFAGDGMEATSINTGFGTSPIIGAMTAYTLLIPTTPDAPINVLAAAGSSQATVEFSAPPSDGGSPILGYTVISSPPGGFDEGAGTTALTHTITGLTNGTAYIFSVVATNAVGSGPASAGSSIVTPMISTYPLTVTLTGSGTVSGTTTGSPASISYPASGSISISAGATAGLIPSAASGFVFVAWTGCDSVSGTTCSVAMDNSKLVAAEFAAVTTTTVGNLAGGRGQHTATLLANGRVLIAGGGDGPPIGMLEIYDPATGATLPAGSLLTPRRSHTATTLVDGKVLLAGGFGQEITGFTIVNSAELYDPATGTISAVGSMSTTRMAHTATRLANGKVLIIGGNIYGGVYTPSAELYDPPTGTFSPTGSLVDSRGYHTATLLADGRVLVTGGQNASTTHSSAEIYDPVTGLFSTTGAMSIARIFHTATALPDGRVLVAGGAGVDLFDPLTGLFSAAGSISSYQLHSTTLLPNGHVLFAGGVSGTGITNILEEYDPNTGSVVSSGYMANNRGIHTATLLSGGKVAIIGGFGSGGGMLSSVEIFDSAAASFTATGSMATARGVPTATLLPSGKVLVAGGGTLSGAVATAEIYDPAGNIWSPAGTLVDARYFHTATLLPSGKVLVAGGTNGSDLVSTELYDPLINSWLTGGNLATARSGHTATQLHSGKVLVTGGTSAGSVVTAVEIYDPATNGWSLAAALGTPRVYHVATLLPDGRVLVTGGSNNFNSAIAPAELYDPATDSWSSAGSLATGRHDHVAALLPNGKVLVTGGWQSGPLNSAELYDPVSNTWSATGSLNIALASTATVLASGELLATGGFNGSSSLTAAELYNPASGSWSIVGNMGTGRHQQITILLPNGKVLVAGGNNYAFGSSLASAELYDPGLGFSDARRPVVSGMTFSGTHLVLVGSGFTGDSEASGGATNSSASNYPLLQLQRMDNDQTVFSHSDPTAPWSDSSFTSASLSGLPIGWYRATIFTNAIPSEQQLLQIAPAIGVAPMAWNFGNVIIGTSSAPHDFTISNNGLVDLAVSSVTAGGDFTVGAGTCGTFPITLAPNGSCIVNAAFTPAAIGSQNLALVIVSNDPDFPALTVALSGTGIAPAVPDLTIIKSHKGSFTQGQTGATYTIRVTNSGTAPTAGTVTMTDTLPAGLTATALSGTGWSCSLATLTCSRSNALATGLSYPPITLKVNVASNAPTALTNIASVAGGGEVNVANSTDSDPTTIVPLAPDLTITKTHTGDFTRGQVGATYTIKVTNSGTVPTAGLVTVTDTLPAGLTATAMSGTGWTCSLGTLTCTRSNALAAGSRYPNIILRVDVASDAPASVINTATVSGGGEINTANDTASNPTTIN